MKRKRIKGEKKNKNSMLKDSKKKFLKRFFSRNKKNFIVKKG